MKRLILLTVILTISGCACEKTQHEQACKIVKRVVITSLVVGAAVALRNSCERDRSYRFNDHDVYLNPPNCSTGACR